VIVDYRNNHKAISDAELERWRSVGASTILLTVHHPEAFSEVSLGRLRAITDKIAAHDLVPGIYTGLLGIEKASTIERHGLEAFFQRPRAVAVAYSRLSFHFSIRTCLSTLGTPGKRSRVTEYLHPMRDVIETLATTDTPYAVTTPDHPDISRYPVLLLPRAVALSDAEVSHLRGYASVHPETRVSGCSD